MAQELDTNPKTAKRARPRASDYFWRPWYAKLWWKLAAAFWVLLAINEAVVPILPWHDRAWTFALLMVFHPFVMFPVLGFSFARAWFDYSRFHGGSEWKPTDNEGFRVAIDDPMDASDPRFNTLPTNPASPAWHERHALGHD